MQTIDSFFTKKLGLLDLSRLQTKIDILVSDRDQEGSFTLAVTYASYEFDVIVELFLTPNRLPLNITADYHLLLVYTIQMNRHDTC